MTNCHADEPISVLVKHFVKPGCQGSFFEWNDQLLESMKQFNGFIGQTVFPPDRDEPLLYHVIFRFASIDQLQNWWKSDEYSQSRAKLVDIVERQPEFKYSSGLEHWFSPQAATASNTPPTYKMAMLVYLSLLPLVFMVSPLVQSLPVSIPGWGHMLVSTALCVGIDCYVTLPIVTRLFSGWLYPSIK